MKKPTSSLGLLQLSYWTFSTRPSSLYCYCHQLSILYVAQNQMYLYHTTIVLTLSN